MSTADIRARYFDTAHLTRDLRARSVRGGVITVASQGAKFALQIASTIILARLLLPADFGLIAMVTAVIGFVALFKDAGLSMATVQKAEITHEQVSTLFWINVALSSAVMLVVMALAPLLVVFYSEPRLLLITMALGGLFLVSGLTVQHQALLRRQMEFRSLSIIEIGSMATGVGVALAMAISGMGYWSLVGLTAGTTIANCTLVWFFCRWRPGLPVRDCGVGSMVRFGGNLTAFSFVNHFSRNMDNVLIGWWWGAGPLGLYAKAYSLLMLPITQINAPVSAVVIPALSRLQSEPERYRRYYGRAINLVATAGMPVCAFAFASAEPLVLTLLGQRWAGMIPIFQALAPAAFAGTLNIANGWVFVSLGRADRQFRWGLVMAVITVSAFVIGLPWGAMGVAIAYSTVFVASRWPGFIYCFRGTPIRPADVGHAIWRPMTASLAAAGATLGVAKLALPRSDDLVALFVSAFVFPAVFAVVILLTPGGISAAKHTLGALKDLKRGRRSKDDAPHPAPPKPAGDTPA